MMYLVEESTGSVFPDSGNVSQYNHRVTSLFGMKYLSVMHTWLQKDDTTEYIVEGLGLAALMHELYGALEDQSQLLRHSSFIMVYIIL